MAESRRTAGEYVANGMLDLNNEAMKEVADHMLRGAPKVTRFAAKRIPGAPGLPQRGCTEETVAVGPEPRTSVCRVVRPLI